MGQDLILNMCYGFAFFGSLKELHPWVSSISNWVSFQHLWKPARWKRPETRRFYKGSPQAPIFILKLLKFILFNRKPVSNILFHICIEAEGQESCKVYNFHTFECGILTRSTILFHTCIKTEFITFKISTHTLEYSYFIMTQTCSVWNMKSGLLVHLHFIPVCRKTNCGMECYLPKIFTKKIHQNTSQQTLI